MNKMLIIAVLLIFCRMPSLFAQVSGGSSHLTRPSLILFKLNESTTQIEAYRRSKNQEALAQTLEDDRQINRSIISDFKQHFTLCPVYFFYDRDYAAVKSKDWDQVTFYDFEHLESPKKIETTQLANYFISEVDYPPVTHYDTLDLNTRRGSDLQGGDDYAAARDYCLLLYDEDFRLLKGKIGVTNISLRKTGSIFKPASRQYTFYGAASLQRVLEKFTRP